MPTHTVGVGGIVVADNKILMIQDKHKSHRFIYKLPGGMTVPFTLSKPKFNEMSLP